MRMITSWITYQRIGGVLKGENSDADYGAPFVGEGITDAVSEGDMARLERFAERRIREIYAATDVFTMGEFWTGNIIVRVNEETKAVEKAYVVDWEVTKPGIPFLDFGQLAAELYTVGCFHEERRQEIDEGL